jgi:pantothenate kinase-related protein Tda10
LKESLSKTARINTKKKWKNEKEWIVWSRTMHGSENCVKKSFNVFSRVQKLFIATLSVCFIFSSS